MARKTPTKKKEIQKPYCFVSYSTKEAHVVLLLECVTHVFSTHFKIQCTPSALASGASQCQQITDLIDGCAFAVVILDGLRPNVVFEYGILHGKNKPVILLRELGATVDISSYFDNPASLGVQSVPLDLNAQFSDIKDINWATWNRFEFGKTAKLLWEEYCKKKSIIKSYVEIEEPKL